MQLRPPRGAPRGPLGPDLAADAFAAGEVSPDSGEALEGEPDSDEDDAADA
jgi:hypothetical protein